MENVDTINIIDHTLAARLAISSVTFIDGFPIQAAQVVGALNDILFILSGFHWRVVRFFLLILLVLFGNFRHVDDVLANSGW